MKLLKKYLIIDKQIIAAIGSAAIFCPVALGYETKNELCPTTTSIHF